MLVRYAEIHFLVRPYRTGDMKLFKRFVYHSEPVQRAFGVSSVYYTVFTAVKRKLQLFRYLYSVGKHLYKEAAVNHTCYTVKIRSEILTEIFSAVRKKLFGCSREFRAV